MAALAAGLVAARGAAAQLPAPSPQAAPSTAGAPAVVASATAPSSAPASAARPEDVTVRGVRARPRDVGGEETSAKELRDVPGTFGEPFQAIAALPGVASTASGLPYFYVRGAPPADTGYYLDGIPLPTLFHVGPGPSVVPPGLVDRIDFFPGATPARYGRYVGGVIAAETLPPSAISHGEAEVRMFDASALVESPLGGGWTALAAGRYGYPNVILSTLHAGVSLDYDDYTLRLTRDLGHHERITLFALGGYDRETDSLQLFPVDTQFHRVDARYDRQWRGGSLRIGTTFGYDRTAQPFSDGTTVAVTETSVRVRVDAEQRFGPAIHLSMGGDLVSGHYGYVTSGLAASSPLDLEQIAGAYLEAHVRLAPRVDVVPGLRFDAYRSAGTLTPSFDPRVSARIGIGDAITWTSVLGLAHQEPTLLVPIPGLRVDPTGGLQQVFQVAEGVEARGPLDLWGSVTGFVNVDRNTSDFVSECGTVSASSCGLVERVRGETYGVEVLLRRSLSEHLGGWLSYTWSRAQRSVGGARYLSPFDRTHSLSAVARYDLGRGWSAGLRVTYYSGRPDFPRVAYGDQSGTVTFGPGVAEQHRLPPFYRVDLRAEKRWTLGWRSWIGVAFDFFNVTFDKEAIAYECVPDVAATGASSSATCTAQSIGPIALPSLGIEGGF